MKTIKIHFTLLNLLLTTIVFSQNVQVLVDEYTLTQGNFDKKTVPYENIKGSPYLMNEFQDAVLYTKDQRVYKLQMRYNIYNNSMEYFVKNVSYEISNPNYIGKIIMNNRIFIYVTMNKNSGYYELIESGKCTLLRKYSVGFREAEQPKPYIDSRPAQFIRNTDQFYFLLDDTIVKEIRKRKDIVKALENQAVRVDQYLNDRNYNKINIVVLKDIVLYYNGLQ